MPTYEYAKSIRPTLAEELKKAGIPATVEFDGRLDEQGNWVNVTKAWVTTDTPKAAVDTVVQAHDPATYDSAVTQERTRFQNDIANIKAFMGTPNSQVTLLALVAIVKALVRVLYKLVGELREQ